MFLLPYREQKKYGGKALQMTGVSSTDPALSREKIIFVMRIPTCLYTNMSSRFWHSV